MPPKVPTTTRALTLRKSTGRKPVYHDVDLEERPIPVLKKGEVLVKVNAAGFNHRDVWIRKGMYPGIVFGSTLGGDAAGVVVASSDSSDPLLNKRVFLVPTRGWEKDPDGPESLAGIGIMGGGKLPAIGAFSEYVAVERDQVIPSPEHLDDVHVAAWPIGGVTSWRAVHVNARVEKGHNVFITGIGGGVALLALQICLAKGANVYVSSSSEAKIAQAVALGAKGGVNYKNAEWPKQLAAILKKSDRPYLDSVIDSGGGDLARQLGSILRPGGRIVCYGMTASPQISFTMREVLKNHKLIGSTMGSHQDLIDATRFLAEHKIVPVVSHVCDGLSSAEEGFELMKQGAQFGKIIIKIHDDSGLTRSKL
ncbi:hypothetical protein EVG20_g3946 [Dentipellis fragilis]|uniref:Enoyl reductase (ER) domain-containing protein n=1 Tax=Dentipellis fragilis TaxID=205917 RepID=A0A4Y9Z0A6_9AGAM|nr:hypothetical protein EVG20_g3946 [Dentipellis fragilis]